jgi:hypothetical protein
MGVVSTQSFTFRLMAGSPAIQLDTFDDEDILLSNNVTGLFDVGLLPSDFTRQITLPGTKVNNAFFEHAYDISIQNPFIFATNIKVPCYFDFDSIYLSDGYLQLNKINVRANKFIESYEITVYGSLSSFGRDINRLYLTDLTSLAIYNHTSSYDNIKASWTGSLFNGDIVYPWCDYGSGWQYTSDVFFGVDDNYGGLSVQDYKPAIRVKPVLDAIFSEAGYTYSSSFMNQAFLDDVYMVCNNSLKYPEYSDVDLETFGVMKLGAISGSTNVTIPMDTWTTLPWQNELIDPGGFLNNGAYTVTKQSNLSGIFNLNFSVSSSGNLPGQFGVRLIETSSAYTTGQIDTIPTWAQYFTQLANGRSSTQSIGQDFELISQVQFPAVPTGSYYFQVKINEYYVASDPLIKVDPNTSGGDVTTKSYIQIKKVNQAADGRVLDIPSNMPYGTTGIKQIDFILGLQKKFNLVIYPDKTNQNRFIIETFNNWYQKGQIKDFNRYINVDDNIEFIPANNLAVNKLNFGDTLDQDYISQQFSKAANREYGKTYYVDTTNFYSQGTFEVKTTFASGPLIRMPGTGLSGSVGGISDTITQYSAGTWSFTSGGALSACSSTTQIQIFTANGLLTSGQVAYYDQYGNDPVIGYTFFSNGFLIYAINSSTGVISVSSARCGR